jgi:hypothetical protein
MSWRNSLLCPSMATCTVRIIKLGSLRGTLHRSWWQSSHEMTQITILLFRAIMAPVVMVINIYQSYRSLLWEQRQSTNLGWYESTALLRWREGIGRVVASETDVYVRAMNANPGRDCWNNFSSLIVGYNIRFIRTSLIFFLLRVKITMNRVSYFSGFNFTCMRSFLFFQN